VRPAQCWSKILGYTLLAEDWPYLAEVSEKALQVARVRGWKKLQEEAVVGQTEARNHLRASGKPGSPAAAAQPGSPGAGLPGGYTMNELANVVGAQANAFRACYETALAKEPTLAGRFKYRILLDAGRVTSVESTNPTKQSAPIDGCIAAQFKRLSFPAKGKATVVYPFVFKG
jgi:hypothetical protein